MTVTAEARFNRKRQNYKCVLRTDDATANEPESPHSVMSTAGLTHPLFRMALEGSLECVGPRIAHVSGEIRGSFELLRNCGGR